MAKPRSIRLLQITDTHLLGSRDGLLRGIPTYATLQAVQTDAAQKFPDSDGVLLTGDLVQDDAAGYALIREAFQASSVPVYCVPGNHDLPDAMRNSLTGAPFVLDDHIILDNWLCLMLSTWRPYSAGGELGAVQLQRLDELLGKHPDLHALVCLHHHPIPMHSRWLDEVGLQDANALLDCLARHTQVRGVLWGHVHQAFDEYRDNVRFMATPATCAQFLPGSRDFALDNKPPGYRTLELHADGSISSEVIWLNH